MNVLSYRFNRTAGSVLRAVLLVSLFLFILLWSCSSPLDINTFRRQSVTDTPPVVAKYLNIVFEGDDKLGTQDGCELTWYSGITDSIYIDTTGRIATVHFYAKDIKVKNVVLGKYAELQTFSIRFDSLVCSNLSTSLIAGMPEKNGSEMTIKYGSQNLTITADGKKNKITIAATEHRPARLIQCRFAVAVADPYDSRKEMQFSAHATIIY